MTPTQIAQAEAHWAAIRARLPPFKFPPQPPSVAVSVTDNLESDLGLFKIKREKVLADYAAAVAKYNGGPSGTRTLTP